MTLKENWHISDDHWGNRPFSKRNYQIINFNFWSLFKLYRSYFSIEFWGYQLDLEVNCRFGSVGLEVSPSFWNNFLSKFFKKAEVVFKSSPSISFFAKFSEYCPKPFSESHSQTSTTDQEEIELCSFRRFFAITNC